MITEYKEYLNEYQEEVNSWSEAAELNLVCACPVSNVPATARELHKKAVAFCRRNPDAVLYDCEENCLSDLLTVTCDITDDTAVLACHIVKQ